MASLGTLVPVSPLNASDDTRHAFSANVTETASFALADVAADFASMSSLNWRVEYRQQNRRNDTLGLGIRIVSGATILAAADAGGTFADVSTNITNTADQTSAATAFAYVNTSADMAAWNAATVELQQTYSKSQASDGAFVEVDYVAITGDYVATIPPATGTLAVSESGNDAAAASGSVPAQATAALGDTADGLASTGVVSVHATGAQTL